MNQWKTVAGVVQHVGQVQISDGRGDCCLLDSLVIQASDGQTVRMVNVVVPGAIYELLQPGAVGNFDILILYYPKPFGSVARSFVVRMRSAEAYIEGMENVKAWVHSSKGAALHLLWYGIFLMPAFGFGLLLWICAGRLLALHVPSNIAAFSQRG